MRYTVEIPDKLSKVFKRIAAEAQISQSELMRRALLTYAVLHREISKGRQVSIILKGKIERELIL
jgi:metal-responsive CopG/Arc/MetJ family transcriptional regulator